MVTNFDLYSFLRLKISFLSTIDLLLYLSLSLYSCPPPIIPIPEIKIVRPGASHVVLAKKESTTFSFSGIEDALSIPGVEVRVFGKPSTRVNRRMAVVLAPDVETAKNAAGKITIN